MPGVASMAELNELLAAGDVIDDARHIVLRPEPVGVAFAAEVASMMPRSPSGQGFRPR